jgi:hypothetical protein
MEKKYPGPVERPDVGRQIDQAEPSEDVRRRVAEDIEQHTADALHIPAEKPAAPPGQAEGGPSNPGAALTRDRVQ